MGAHNQRGSLAKRRALIGTGGGGGGTTEYRGLLSSMAKQTWCIKFIITSSTFFMRNQAFFKLVHLIHSKWKLTVSQLGTQSIFKATA